MVFSEMSQEQRNELVTDVIVATPLHVEHYPFHEVKGCTGALVLRHEKGHRMHAHYLNEFWLYTAESHIKAGIIGRGADAEGKRINYLGFYKDGVFKIVNEHNDELFEKYRQNYKNLKT